MKRQTIMPKKITLKTIIQSVLSSALGVQKKENYERDFSEGKASHFIAAGVIATLLFIFLLIGVVQLVTRLI